MSEHLQPLCLMDFCRSREGQQWTPADSAEIDRQVQRINELVTQIFKSARKEATS